jgi:hypothetical protein
VPSRWLDHGWPRLNTDVRLRHQRAGLAEHALQLLLLGLEALLLPIQTGYLAGRRLLVLVVLLLSSRTWPELRDGCSGWPSASGTLACGLPELSVKNSRHRLLSLAGHLVAVGTDDSSAGSVSISKSTRRVMDSVRRACGGARLLQLALRDVLAFEERRLGRCRFAGVGLGLQALAGHQLVLGTDTTLRALFAEPLQAGGAVVVVASLV